MSDSSEQDPNARAAAQGGAIRSMLRTSFLAVTKRASIGRLPIKHVAKLSSSADTAYSIFEPLQEASKAQERLSARAIRYGYGFARSAVLGTALFSTYDFVLQNPHFLKGDQHVRPFLAGATAGTLHGSLEYFFSHLEKVAQFYRTNTQNAGLHFGRVSISFPKLAIAVGRNSVSHACLFGIYTNFFNLFGPLEEELRDIAKVENEYGHLFSTTLCAGLLAGAGQEMVSLKLSRQPLFGPDIRKAAVASAIGFLAMEFARFDDEEAEQDETERKL